MSTAFHRVLLSRKRNLLYHTAIYILLCNTITCRGHWSIVFLLQQMIKRTHRYQDNINNEMTSALQEMS